MTMKLPRLLLSALGAVALLAAPATSLADRKISVYRDGDGDGHYNKKKIEIPSHRSYRGGSSYYGHRPYGYRPYSYSYGPSVSFSVSRSYRAPVYSDYSDDLAVDVQRELRRRGYYRGSIDGDVGPGTRNAIRAYQYDRGLSVSGRIDRSLLRALGIG